MSMITFSNLTTIKYQFEGKIGHSNEYHPKLQFNTDLYENICKQFFIKKSFPSFYSTVLR